MQMENPSYVSTATTLRISMIVLSTTACVICNVLIMLVTLLDVHQKGKAIDNVMPVWTLLSRTARYFFTSYHAHTRICKRHIFNK